MSNHKKRRILAIDPGTREMGIAVLENSDLIHHGVLVLAKRGSPHARLQEGRQAILRLIRDFQPEVLAVETAFFANNRSTALLNVLVDEIRSLGRRNGIRVVSFAPSTVKKGITGNGHASKAEVAKAVVARYPELKVYLTQDRKWKARYHENMFDAVAVGVVCQEQLLVGSRQS